MFFLHGLLFFSPIVETVPSSWVQCQLLRMGRGIPCDYFEDLAIEERPEVARR